MTDEPQHNRSFLFEHLFQGMTPSDEGQMAGKIL